VQEKLNDSESELSEFAALHLRTSMPYKIYNDSSSSDCHNNCFFLRLRDDTGASNVSFVTALRNYITANQQNKQMYSWALSLRTFIGNATETRHAQLGATAKIKYAREPINTAVKFTMSHRTLMKHDNNKPT